MRRLTILCKTISLRHGITIKAAGDDNGSLILLFDVSLA